MHVPHLLNQPLKSVAGVEVVDRFRREPPRPIHPEAFDDHLLHDLDEARRVVIVCMRQHHVIDEEVAAVVRPNVLDDFLAGLRVTAVYDVDKEKSDRNDAAGIARIMQTGWFKEVRVKDLDSHSVRALLASRALLVKIKRDLER